MKLVLFWVFILTFGVLFTVTMLGVMQTISIPGWILGELATSVLVALSGAAIAVFKGTKVFSDDAKHPHEVAKQQESNRREIAPAGTSVSLSSNETEVEIKAKEIAMRDAVIQELKAQLARVNDDYAKTRGELQALTEQNTLSRAQAKPIESAVRPPDSITPPPSPAEPPLTQEVFHVLKWFSQIDPNTGSGNVDLVADACGLVPADAIACLKELRGLKLVKVAIPKPNEWNSHYAITDEGRHYVTTHDS
ncbi:MAG: hypothetical protein ACLQVY_10235 [Limisphaerales bacterium]